jgi:hypothetical protein
MAGLVPRTFGSAKTVFASRHGATTVRHARACRGHPRGENCANNYNLPLRRGVDGRDKPGHDPRRLGEEKMLVLRAIPRLTRRAARLSRAPTSDHHDRRCADRAAVSLANTTAVSRTVVRRKAVRDVACVSLLDLLLLPPLFHDRDRVLDVLMRARIRDRRKNFPLRRNHI